MSQMLHDVGWHVQGLPVGSVRLGLLYKIVTGHVAINPDQIGLIVVDNRTRANHRYKFRTIGASSTVVRMDPFRFLAGCRTRRLNQAYKPGLVCLSYLSML